VRLVDLLDGLDEARPAVVSPEDRRTISHGEVIARIDDLSRRLASMGVGESSTAALVLPNGLALVELVLALTSLGAVVAPLNPVYTRREYDLSLKDIEPDFVVLPANELAAAREVAGRSRIVEVVDDGATLALHAQEPSVRAARGPASASFPDDVALLLRTSGTTAKPKKVPLLNRNLVASAKHIAAHYELTAEDVSYCVMPLFHVHGLVASVLAALSAGGSVVIPRRVSPRRFRADFVQQRATWFSAAPTLLRMLLGDTPSSIAHPSLRFVRTCSSALPPDLQQLAEGELGVPVLEAYGMTEASHQISSNPLPPRERISGTVGIGTGAEIKLIDGEVAIRGAGVMPGYLDEPQANADSFVDGWFRTGDLGAFDRGYLRLTGRLKEMILRGGENVSPYEVENVLLRHPAVEDAVCFGVASEQYGEEVAAAVRCRTDVTDRELRRHCREHLSAYKIPTTICVVDAIPRTATGKLQRARMVSLLAEQLVR
jgi:acyl-CoA synthetase (AMP-forming)/AMP-acid ligase II